MMLFLFVSKTSISQSKQQLYAGFILHIMKYVEWPEYGDNMTVGVVNDPELVRALQMASKGKKIHYKNVAVQKLDDVSNIQSVDVLYISKKAHRDLPGMTQKAIAQKILVITENKSKEMSGIAINFFEENGRMRFELYESTISRIGIKVSEQLRKLAVLK